MTSRFLKRATSERIGGKAYALKRARSAGVSVPEFHTLEAEHFGVFCSEHRIDERFLDAISLSGRKQSEAVEEIRLSVRTLPFSKKTSRALLDIAEVFKGRPLAVRSSATAEDGQEDSFAGLFTSVLNVTEGGLQAAVRECWASVFTQELLAYRKLKGHITTPQMAVIVQQMVSFTRSGVLFTRSPVESEKETMVIEAVEGLSDKLVAGEIEGERHVLDGDGNRLAFTPLKQGAGEIVDSELSGELCDIGNKLEHAFGSPQDIEWGEIDGTVYVVQSRPITTLDAIGHFRIWDNANIVENYGGITLPLTFSVMQNAYHHVYVQFCRVMGVSQSRLVRLDPSLREMLGLIRGRVYYNLLNWYRLIGILPLFQSNAYFMERMMGTRAKLPPVVDEQLRREIQGESRSRFRAIWTGLSFVFYHLTAPVLVGRFLRWFDSEYASFRALPFSSMTAEELFGAYEDAEKTFLANWRAPIINDFLVMVHHGLFRSLAEKWLPKEKQILVNELIRSGDRFRSLEPTRRMMSIARRINKDEGLTKRISSDTNPAALKELLSSPDTSEDVRTLIREYVQEYFFRTLDEMKLEKVDLTVDDEYLYQCLLGYIRSGRGARSQDAGRVPFPMTIQSLKKDATFFQRVVLGWSLKNTRRAIRHREDTRFARSELFGVLRILFRRLGERFVEKGWLEKEDSIYFLTLDEVRDILEGHHLGSDKLIMLTTKRRALYATYSDESLPDRFETRTKDVDAETHSYVEGDSAVQPESVLRGTACSSGIAEGTIVVVRSAKDVKFDAETILVAERTDPGWTPLFAAATGLIVERGGLLSHAAIVAREFGLPTLIGVKNATKIFKNGMRVRIDGNRGFVEILESNEY